MGSEPNYREYRTIDKSAWGDGMWQEEPDKAQWIDAETGLDCLIVRVEHSGHLCGYVGVGPDHPLHGKGYGTIDSDIDVHGGLTFASACADGPDESRGICHIAAPGRPEHVWWFGFDCAHCWDSSPARDAKYPELFSARHDEQYRSWPYVQSEICKLAAQLAASPAPRTEKGQ